jgi:hypothetical protein
MSASRLPIIASPDHAAHGLAFRRPLIAVDDIQLTRRAVAT